MAERFALDKPNAKLMGVCSGFARWTNFDVTLTRVAMVVLTIATGGTMIVAYLAAGLIAPAA